MAAQWEEVKEFMGKFFTKSKVKTEERLQIAQLNQKLRSLRNEREESIKRLGEETYSRWKKDQIDVGGLEEIMQGIEEKEKEIERMEEEKEKVKRLFAEKIREVDAENSEKFHQETDENDKKDLDKSL